MVHCFPYFTLDAAVLVAQILAGPPLLDVQRHSNVLAETLMEILSRNHVIVDRIGIRRRHVPAVHWRRSHGSVRNARCAGVRNHGSIFNHESPLPSNGGASARSWASEPKK